MAKMAPALSTVTTSPALTSPGAGTHRYGSEGDLTSVYASGPPASSLVGAHATLNKHLLDSFSQLFPLCLMELPPSMPAHIAQPSPS